LRFSLHS